MIVVACTGGIGAGKSTVASLLARRGAVVVDADALARAALEPGTPGYAAVLERFGPSVRSGAPASDAPARDASAPPPIDRARLAGIVFADPSALADLEAIVHPAVREATDAVLAAHERSDDVVVLDLPLLVGRDGRRAHRLDGVLVVDAPEDVALERLVRDRHMDPADARARMAAQPDRRARLREADFVVTNLGTRAELEATVEQAWDWIVRLREAAPGGAPGEGGRGRPSGEAGRGDGR